MNKVNLQGKVIRIFKGRRRTIITLFIDGYRKNFPSVVFTSKEMREKAESFNKGDFVNINGTVKVRREFNDEHPYFVQFIKGESIEYAKSELEQNFGDDIKGIHTYINKVIVSGNALFTRENNAAKNLVISSPTDKFNILLTSYSDEDLNYEKGTPVYVIGEVQTVKKENDENVRHFENIVITDISTKE